MTETINNNKQAYLKERGKLVQYSEQNAIDYIWKTLFVIVTIITVLLFNNIYEFKTNQIFRYYQYGSLYELLGYGLSFSFIFTILDMKIHLVFDPLCDKYVINHEKFPDPQVRKARCFTLVKWGYSLIYYFISSVFAYYLIYHTDALPGWLGGNGQCLKMVHLYPIINVNPQIIYWMKIFYIGQFGKHFSRTFTHIFIKPEGKFYEFALHHVLSTYLIVFSYLTNFWLFGILVLFVHDASDFFLIITRFYRQETASSLFYKCFVFLIITWIFFRIIGLGGCCIYPAYYISFGFDYQTDFNLPIQIAQYYSSVLFWPGFFMAIMMSILLILHAFWTYHIGKSFVSACVSEKIATHNYD